MATRVDPYKNFKFLVEIDGITQAGFSECSGFGSSVEIIEYREGGEAGAVRKLPGLTKFSNITLKRGVTDSRELQDWHLSAINGELVRRNGSVILLDDAGQERVRWNFSNAWVSRFEGPDFIAKGNDVAIETLTICCERLERAS